MAFCAGSCCSWAKNALVKQRQGIDHRLPTGREFDLRLLTRSAQMDGLFTPFCDTRFPFEISGGRDGLVARR
jgi:hypothetical protein